MSITTGTPKQAQWAQDIKAQAISRVETYITTANASQGKSAKTAAQLAVIIPAIEALTDAGWWIDRNDILATSLLREILTPAIKDQLRNA